ADVGVPEACRAPVRFVLGVEISSIYKKGGKVRKVHNLVFAPTLAAAGKINERLGKIGNIRSDGRPILGLGAKELLAVIKEVSAQAYLIPAHAWTPHFAVFGSESGFDSLQECFEELTPEIFAIETGLSSDPSMNRRLSGLDQVALISNSDAHSAAKLAREANVLDTELSYAGIFDAFRSRDKKKFWGTLEFFAQEGKYHMDGHRACKTRLWPKETMARAGRCPVCAKPVTVGVLHRVEKLADRDEGYQPKGSQEFQSIVPLMEILAQVHQVGVSSVKVEADHFKLLARFGNELHILRELPPERLRQAGYMLLATGIERMRAGQVEAIGGYDGEYGSVRVLRPEDFKLKDRQKLTA
ncbi:MAG: endonuclease Q family protein, partial [Elusimicrobiota bacterium]